MSASWHAHVGWLFRTKGMERGASTAGTCYEDRLIRLIDRLYFVWVALTFGIPFAIGWAVGGGAVGLGLQAIVWGGLMRIFLFQHATLGVNSVCHMFGSRDFETRTRAATTRGGAADVRRGLAQQPPRVPAPAPGTGCCRTSSTSRRAW